MTIPLFMLCKKVSVRSELVRKALANLTLCGFGVYMVHYALTGPAVAFARADGVPTSLQIPVASVLAFGFSWLAVLALRRVMGGRARYVVG